MKKYIETWYQVNSSVLAYILSYDELDKNTNDKPMVTNATTIAWDTDDGQTTLRMDAIIAFSPIIASPDIIPSNKTLIKALFSSKVTNNL